jgi:hypothetical protein
MFTELRSEDTVQKKEEIDESATPTWNHEQKVDDDADLQRWNHAFAHGAVFNQTNWDAKPDVTEAKVHLNNVVDVIKAEPREESVEQWNDAVANGSVQGNGLFESVGKGEQKVRREDGVEGGLVFGGGGEWLARTMVYDS